MNRFINIVTCVLLSVCALGAHADIVTLKDGTTHEGTVIKENRAEVVLEIVISNIKTTKKFARYKVKSIEYKPLEVEKDDEKPSIKSDDTGDEKAQDTPSDAKRGEDAKSEEVTNRPSREERLAARRNRVLYMVVPVEGTIGVETNATGLRNALMQARRQKAKHVIFQIDSPGGYVYDAVASLEVLKEFDKDFEYHALIEEGAISAASIFVAASDQIWVRPGSRVGGAVAYTSDSSSGAAEVDAKFNSIWAAEIASRAESKGHPPEIFRAMVEPGAEVWFDGEGNVSPSRPSTGGAQQIDNATTILTIRADQMIEIGMAKLFEGELSGLGELLDIASWTELRSIGERAMKSAAQERKKLQDRLDGAVEVFVDSSEDFEQNDPRTQRDYRYFQQPDGTYYANGTSMQKWRERTDKAVRDIDNMLAALSRIAEVNKRAKKIGAIHLEQLPNDIGHDAYTTISEVRQWLVQHRNNMPKL